MVLRIYHKTQDLMALIGPEINTWKILQKIRLSLNIFKRIHVLMGLDLIDLEKV